MVTFLCQAIYTINPKHTIIIKSLLKISLLQLALILSLSGYCQTTSLIVTNKKIPALLEKEILKALSYYPELKHTSIDFIFRDNIKNAVMQAQPRVKSIFNDKSSRIYKIKISRYIQLKEGLINIEDVPEDILVGWIAHELGHVMDYLDRSSIQMLGFGIRYLTSKPFLKLAERNADSYAITHGLADHIVKTKNYILHNANMPNDYKDRIDELYLSPEEVRTIQQEINSI